jgi:hypothetical protein
MRFIEKMERRFGRYAIRNLMLYLIIIFAIGLVIQSISPMFYVQYLALDPAAVLKGQVWRLITFLVFPPSTDFIWCALLCYIFYSIGTMLERLWGAFRFNLYIFVGILAMIIGVFICYFIWGSNAVVYSYGMSNSLWLSMLLAVAAMFPDAQFMLMFIIPVKAKWIGYIYAASMVYEFIVSDGTGRVMLVMSILNFLIFFFLTRDVRDSVRQTMRKRNFQKSMQKGNIEFHTGSGQARHRCAVCGRTELDDPKLEFRYCSRCEGNYEYCMDHLYTHVHVTSHDPASHN